MANTVIRLSDEGGADTTITAYQGCNPPLGMYRRSLLALSISKWGQNSFQIGLLFVLNFNQILELHVSDELK